MFVSLQSSDIKPNAQRDSIWMWGLGRRLGDECETVMNEMCGLTRDPMEPPHPFRHGKNNERTAAYKPGSKRLPDMDTAGALILNFQLQDWEREISIS